MKKIIYPVFVILFVYSCKKSNQESPTVFTLENIQQQILKKDTKKILFTFAADSMKGRDSKSGGYTKAAEFVTDYFQANNINPFYPKYQDSLNTDEIVSYNIVGQIGSYDPQKKTILIGAHLDHIGIQGSEGDTIYNGANDNATGSTAVLQVGKYLAQYEWDQNILLALFAEEEKGLRGAYHLAKRFKDENINLDYMVNFEMIGTTLTTGANQVYMTGYTYSNMPELMNSISPNFVQFLPQAKELNLFKRSDNYAFYQILKIPAQTLSSFDFKNYNFYHKAGDEAHKMDIENMNLIIQTTTFTLANMLKENTKIKLSPTTK